MSVEGVLTQASGLLETRTITIEYVTAGSEREAGLIFEEDPRQSTLEIRATSYERP